MKSIFACSSTDYKGLKSTTFSYNGRRHCIHCGYRANGLKEGVTYEHGYSEGCFDTTGYRCSCEEATKEIAKRLAFEEVGGGFWSFGEGFINRFKPEYHSIPDTITKMVVSGNPDYSALTHVDNWVIFQGSVSHKWKQPHMMKYHIKEAVNDVHWSGKAQPLQVFVYYISVYYQEFQDAILKDLEKMKECTLEPLELYRK